MVPAMNMSSRPTTKPAMALFQSNFQSFISYLLEFTEHSVDRRAPLSSPGRERYHTVPRQPYEG